MDQELIEILAIILTPVYVTAISVLLITITNVILIVTAIMIARKITRKVNFG